MTLIRRALYQDLIAERTAISKELSAVTAERDSVQHDLKVEQKFYDNFATTQAGLEENIAGQQEAIEKLEARKESLESDLKALKEAVKAAEDALSEAKDAYKEEAEILGNLKEKGAGADEIAAQQAKVNEASAVVSSAEAALEKAQLAVEANKNATAECDNNIALAEKTKEELLVQIADNKQRYKNAPGNIAEMTDNLARLNADLTELNDRYTAFLDKNKETINSFEEQQLRRDANIRKEAPTRAYNRVPTNAPEVAQAGDVMKEVIEAELEAADEAEQNQRANYLKAGREPNINPDFLTRDQANELTLSTIWSTRSIAKQIKDACMKGEFQTECGALPNSVVYALQEAGYTLHLTNAIDDKHASIIITWENLGGKSA